MNGTAKIKTYTGRYIDLLNPREEDIEFADIAVGLSNLTRFGGQLFKFYSVAEHCVLMSEFLIDSELAKHALLHDAAEAYIGDMVSPLKHSPSIEPVYTVVEEGLMKVIYRKFGLNYYDRPRRVKAADAWMYAFEKVWLGSHGMPGVVLKHIGDNIDTGQIIPEGALFKAIWLGKEVLFEEADDGKHHTLFTIDKLNHWSPEEARVKFISRFKYLWDQACPWDIWGYAH